MFFATKQEYFLSFNAQSVNLIDNCEITPNNQPANYTEFSEHDIDQTHNNFEHQFPVADGTPVSSTQLTTKRLHLYLIVQHLDL